MNDIINIKARNIILALFIKDFLPSYRIGMFCFSIKLIYHIPIIIVYLYRMACILNPAGLHLAQIPVPLSCCLVLCAFV